MSVGCENKWAEYKRKNRETDVSSLENFQSESKIFPTDIEIEKEKNTDIKRERKKENAPEAARSFSPSVKKDDFVLKNKYGSYGWIELSDTEHAQLLDELEKLKAYLAKLKAQDI